MKEPMNCHSAAFIAPLVLHPARQYNSHRSRKLIPELRIHQPLDFDASERAHPLRCVGLEGAFHHATRRLVHLLDGTAFRGVGHGLIRQEDFALLLRLVSELDQCGRVRSQLWHQEYSQ